MALRLANGRTRYRVSGLLRTNGITCWPKAASASAIGASVAASGFQRDSASRANGRQAMRTPSTANAGSTPVSRIRTSTQADIISPASRRSVSNTLAMAWRSATAPKSTVSTLADAAATSRKASQGFNARLNENGSIRPSAKANTSSAISARNSHIDAPSPNGAA